MPSLGSFGTPREPLDLDFQWFGATIRVNPDATDLDFMEFMDNAEKVELPDSIEGLSQAEQMQILNRMTAVTDAMNEFVRQQIHPDDWAEFWRVAKENRQQNSDLMQLSRDITAAVARFRIGPSSDSTATPASAVPKLTVVESSVESRHQRTAAEIRDLLPHRPDLRLALKRQQEAEAAAGLTALGLPG